MAEIGLCRLDTFGGACTFGLLQDSGLRINAVVVAASVRLGPDVPSGAFARRLPWPIALEVEAQDWTN